MQFEWDPDKAESNLAKHGVSFNEAATVFADPLSWTFPDEVHSDHEPRWTTIGRSDSSRLIVVIHRDQEELVRIISARLATRKERNFYEEER